MSIKELSAARWRAEVAAVVWGLAGLAQIIDVFRDAADQRWASAALNAALATVCVWRCWRNDSAATTIRKMIHLARIQRPLLDRYRA